MGGFADVFLGTYNESSVAVKRLRVSSKMGKANLYLVGV
jgi:hypothetical protein